MHECRWTGPYGAGPPHHTPFGLAPARRSCGTSPFVCPASGGTASNCKAAIGSWCPEQAPLWCSHSSNIWYVVYSSQWREGTASAVASHLAQIYLL